MTYQRRRWADRLVTSSHDRPIIPAPTRISRTRSVGADIGAGFVVVRERAGGGGAGEGIVRFVAAWRGHGPGPVVVGPGHAVGDHPAHVLVVVDRIVLVAGGEVEDP